ncbi:iron(III) transport system ATP-binding protein [Rhodobium orientis]|uniref:Iron ABC transporter ATP-binding protein n=1 Tax=Rhodobium orientis TaxID=34017 RepID=A0A327JPD8_9HYPH|nr:ABC transporter ATP-binding protein [Rhodobium orientis]MBB4302171.1 iron(III) transport system ATP-binding protein [Rhodobium orientis]MBK5948882.1 iron ABC transporter ATP-binding protein [Rhodobium orientis]RAI27931.1 iron ABC transporter ATP-binding protein [Rhodobium orientis]
MALSAEREGEDTGASGRLVFENITHHYDSVASVEDVSLEVEPGEVLCLLGQSGSGKTTLLRIAAGIERQSAGRVVVNGGEVAGPDVFLPPERRGVGLMFQDYALFPHLTIVKNVMFGLTDLPKAEAEKVAREALMAVGLAAYADDYPHALSGGEQQRVALARAMAPNPSVLLMDEPFSGLDRRLREDVRENALTAVERTGATCIVVTHDPEEAMRMGDRIALLRRGRIVQVGTPEDLYRRPADLFVARFFSDLNEIPGRVTGGEVETPIGGAPVPGFSEGEAVVVGLRPHDIRVTRGSDRLALDRTPGRVLRRRFLGEVDLLDIAVRGLDRPLSVRRHGSDLAAGEHVVVGFDAAAALVFAAE